MESEYLDPKKRSQRELLLQLIDKFSDLENKVNNHLTQDAKDVKKELEELKIKMAVIQTKAAIIGTLAAIIISAVVQLVIRT